MILMDGKRNNRRGRKKSSCLARQKNETIQSLLIRLIWGGSSVASSLPSCHCHCQATLRRRQLISITPTLQIALASPVLLAIHSHRPLSPILPLSTELWFSYRRNCNCEANAVLRQAKSQSIECNQTEVDSKKKNHSTVLTARATIRIFLVYTVDTIEKRQAP